MIWMCSLSLSFSLSQISRNLEKRRFLENVDFSSLLSLSLSLVHTHNKILIAHITTLSLQPTNQHQHQQACNKKLKVDQADSQGMTPLHHSARNGHLQVAEFLIQSGASVDKKSVDGWTALHLTCENGHVDVIDLLLRQGADPNAMNKNHVTSLMLASREGHVPVIELLLKYGAKINKVAEGGKTALSFAARSGKVDVLRRLIKELKSKKMLNLTTSARPRTCDSLTNSFEHSHDHKHKHPHRYTSHARCRVW